MPEVERLFSNLGHGNPQVYYNHIGANDAANYAEVFVLLHEYDTRRDAARSCRRYARGFDPLLRRAYLRARVCQRPAHFGADFGSRHRPRPRDVIEQLATGAEADGQGDARHPRRHESAARGAHQPALRIDSPKVRPARRARPPSSIARCGSRCRACGGTFKETRRRAVSHRGAHAHATSSAELAALEQVRVPALGGSLLPLSQLATLVFEKAPTLIQRFDRDAP